MKQGLEISVVLPAHNEADNIKEVVEECIEALEGLVSSFEVIVVDDGSTDRTAEIADELAVSDPRVRVIHHPFNQGYGAALRSGFDAACLRFIFFTDSDRQFKISEVEKLIPMLERSDMVVGFREQRKDPLHRVLYGKLFSASIRLLFNVRVRDVNCAFKLFGKSVIHGSELKSPGALINAELLAIAKSKGIDPVEVPVSHLPRVSGIQSGGSVKVILRALAELIELKKRYPRTS